MCSKLIPASKGKSGRTCSRPLISNCRTELQAAQGSGTPFSFETGYHTILLFSSPTARAQVCGTPAAHAADGLRTADGLHQAQLRKSFATAQVCHYEWQDQTRMQRTTLLPLTDKDGHVTEVLSVTQDISTWSNTTKGTYTLREAHAPKTFAQLLLAARETEKREVAKALHDEIGTASVMLLALVGLTKQSVQQGNTKQALRDLERLQAQTQQSIERLRNIIVALRPPSLDTEGALRGNLEELVKDVCQLGRLKYRFECAEQMPEKGIANQVKILLYRMVQEALSNVVKHAQATQVQVSLKRQKGQLFLTVKDNGTGFNTKRPVSVNHVGLRSMQDSVALLGGKLKILSAQGKGTCIEAVCPCVVYEENL